MSQAVQPRPRFAGDQLLRSALSDLIARAIKTAHAVWSPPASAPDGRLVSILTTSERGGAEYASVDLLAALQARGHDVLLLTNAPRLAAGIDIPVCRLNIGPKLAQQSVLRLTVQAPLILLRIARTLHAARPVGAVLVHFKKEQLLCSLLPGRMTGTIVWAEWGPVPAQMRRGLPRLIYALAARRARRIMVVSDGTGRTVVEAGVPREKVVVMPDLVNLHKVEFDIAGRERLRREWGVSEGTLVVGCVSRLQRRKRNDVVIDAMAYLSGDVLLLIAGEGDQEPALRERAAPFGDRVRFVSDIRGYVQEFLSACDLLAFAPSPTEADRPRVIVMAQLVGLPVVATHPEGAGAVQSVGAGTVISPHNDPCALAAAIAVYRDHPERRRREGEVGRRAILQAYDPAMTLSEVERAFGLRP
jgi:glycosyltransferase involved in cell wall biosynthesis